MRTAVADVVHSGDARQIDSIDDLQPGDLGDRRGGWGDRSKLGAEFGYDFNWARQTKIEASSRISACVSSFAPTRCSDSKPRKARRDRQPRIA